jgi:hypothetical protein
LQTVNQTDQIADINPGIGPEVGNFDTGNGFGQRVFWVAKVPDSDLTVNLAAGTAELRVTGLPEYNYKNFADSDSSDWQYDYNAVTHPHGFYNATLDFDIKWKGPVTEKDEVKDPANGFAGTFYQDDAIVSWSAHRDLPVSDPNYFAFTGDPSDSANSNSVAPGSAFNQLATEQNGVFFPSGSSLKSDAANPSLMDLVVQGSSTGGVDIRVMAVHDGRDIRVTIHGAGQDYRGDFPAAAISRLIVQGGPGNNEIAVADSVKVPALLMGSFGNDEIEGGGGRTIIIGGLGSDHLEAGSGGAILIGGTTDFDHTGDLAAPNLAALDAILTEWARTDESYQQRVDHISGATSGGLNGSDFLNASTVHDTVHDDGAGNVLEGGAGPDWFFANLDGIGNNGIMDLVHGRKPGEILTSILFG